MYWLAILAHIYDPDRLLNTQTRANYVCFSHFQIAQNLLQLMFDFSFKFCLRVFSLGLLHLPQARDMNCLYSSCFPRSSCMSIKWKPQQGYLVKSFRSREILHCLISSKVFLFHKIRLGMIKAAKTFPARFQNCFLKLKFYNY